MIEEKNLKVLIVQNNPTLLKKSENIKNCSEMLSKFSL
jgi:predicted amidohydrolase